MSQAATVSPVRARQNLAEDGNNAAGREVAEVRHRLRGSDAQCGWSPTPELVGGEGERIYGMQVRGHANCGRLICCKIRISVCVYSVFSLYNSSYMSAMQCILKLYICFYGFA